MSDGAEASRDAWRRLALRSWPAVAITLVGLVLLWPVPLGHMPMSKDHTVHLTRIWMVGEQLASGQLRGWSSVWFFGAPVGELYPILGDLLIVAIRGLTLGLADWHTAYALGFTVVFVAQGWAMLRVGRALELGLWPGAIAALLCLTDPGAYREGGWIYTVDYGVWPQTLSTTLCWLGFGELGLAALPDVDAADRRKHVALSGLALGGAVLAHPIAIVATALGVPVFLLCLGLRDRSRLRITAVHLGTAIVLALLVAAWWLWPMLAHKAWMSSYGWMWQPLSRMARWASEGQWTQHMPTAAGACVAAGLVLVGLLGNGFARFAGAFALVLWLFTSADTLWTFRLDHLSEGFTHLQWQRFLMTAKPGLFLAVGAGVGLIARASERLWARRSGSPLAIATWAVAAGACVWMLVGQAGAMREHAVGKVQVDRVPGDPDLARDYDDFVAWARTRWDDRDGFYRLAFRSGRNEHFFMDAPVLTGMPMYKLGFTPGDNFVHKPESGQRALLDALRVRYFASTRGRAREGATQFGKIIVNERDAALPAVAAVRGGGEVEVLEDDADGGTVGIRVTNAAPDAVLVFNIAGYPRWALEHQGNGVEWHEVPVVGDAPTATQAERRFGVLRGGKANGDDGTEPTLIAAPAADGEWTLTYVRWHWLDMLALLATTVGVGVCGVLLAGMPAAEAVELRAVRLAHPLLLGAIVVVALAVAAQRWRAGADAERSRAFAWVDDGRATVVERMRAAPFKTDMLIRPALVIRGARKKPARVELPGVPFGQALRGWAAIDDDHAKMSRKGSRTIRVEARSPGGEWAVLHDRQLPHKPGMRRLELPTGELAGTTGDLRVTVTGSGKSPPPLGFDLQLDPGAAP